MLRIGIQGVLAGAVLVLAGCSSTGWLTSSVEEPGPVVPDASLGWQADPLLQRLVNWDQQQPHVPVQTQNASRWNPQRWSALPGLSREGLLGVWPAWQSVCKHPAQARTNTCQQVQLLAQRSEHERLEWLITGWQPMRVESLSGAREPGLLTGYYEPHMQARRLPDDDHQTPLYALPKGWRQSPNRPWFSRAEIDNDSRAQQALAGRVLVWMRDPIDALMLQIQGSGRMDVTEPDGTVRTVRLAFAGHNGHPYRSVAKPLLERRAIKAGSWEHMREWASKQPSQTVREWIQTNPRVVFFREVALNDPDQGPLGAHATPLWPGRSIAVDRNSIQLGQPVWLSSAGPHVSLNKLVMAQDTGAAIVGSIRADYFAGWGEEAYQVAARLKQPLHLWTLVPRAP